MAGSRRGLTTAWLLTCSTTPDIYRTGQPARERSQGSQPTRQKRGLPPRLQDQHGALAGAESPHCIPSGREDGSYPGAFLLLIGFSLLTGRNSGQLLKTEKLGYAGQGQVRTRVPENPYRQRRFSSFAGRCFVVGELLFESWDSIALVRIDLGQIL